MFIVGIFDGKLTRTSLVKYLYLIDLEYLKIANKTLTGIDYIFYHYGPYSAAIIDDVNELCGFEIQEYERVARNGNVYYIYRRGNHPRFSPQFKEKEIEAIKRVINRHPNANMNKLLEDAYNSLPVCKATRGEVIDLKKYTVKIKMDALQKRAKNRLKNQELRKVASKKELDLYNNNFKDMEAEVFLTIK